MAEISAQEAKFCKLAMDGWSRNPNLTVLGNRDAHRLPIFSLLIKDDNGQVVSEQAFTETLSDLYGIQARGGCACAGPYGHRLLGIDRAKSEQFRNEILAGDETNKPGWVRVNFGYLMPDETVQYVIDSMNELASNWQELAPSTAKVA